MSAIHLALDIPCTRDDAARLFAVLIFLAQLETDPDAKPGPELDATFGANAREALLGIIGHPVPLGIDCRYDPVTNLLSVTDVEGRPNLSAVPVLLLWLYPDKLPLAYAAHTAARPEHKVWTLIGLNRIVFAGCFELVALPCRDRLWRDDVAHRHGVFVWQIGCLHFVQSLSLIHISEPTRPYYSRMPSSA